MVCVLCVHARQSQNNEKLDVVVDERALSKEKGNPVQENKKQTHQIIFPHVHTHTPAFSCILFVVLDC